MGRLPEEGWELDGVRFGSQTQIFVLADGLDYGTTNIRTQDVARSQRDGFMVGRDYRDGPEMQFTLGVQHGLDVWPVIEALAQTWTAPGVASTPGALSVLRHRRAGRTYRMLGRGRKFDVSAGHRKNDRFQQVTATFQLADPERYLEPVDGPANHLEMPLVAPSPDGGVRPPYAAPWRTVPNTQPRVGEVTVGGTRPAPFMVQVFGPSAGGSLQGFTISGDGWRFVSSQVLAYDQSALIDTRAMTFERAGLSLESSLARGCRLDARLVPGHQFVKFSGGDPSGSSRAVLSWLDTVPA